jgi:opacity protein-like surface antigen
MRRQPVAGEVGYVVPPGPFAIVGACAGVDGSVTKACLTDERLGGISRDCVKAGRTFTAGARLGYPFGSTGLLYCKLGYSHGRVEERYTDSWFPEDKYRDGTNRDGLHLGGGVEIGRAKGAYGKGEYVYTNYNG